MEGWLMKKHAIGARLEHTDKTSPLTHDELSFISHLDRLKYFDLCLSQQEEEQDYSDEWTPVIDMKEFQDACFQGKVEKNPWPDMKRGWS